MGQPQAGYSWEGFVVQQIMANLPAGLPPYFYLTAAGTELDLMLSLEGKPPVGIEVRVGNAPKISKGTTVASQDLNNLPVWVVTHSVDEDYPHHEQVRVTSFERIFFHLGQMGLLGN